MTRESRNARKLGELAELMRGKSNMLVILQDHPDPDAMGAAVALRTLGEHLAGLNCQMACAGTAGRGENRALVTYLGLDLQPLGAVDLSSFDLLAMVDAQPDHGNVSLPDGASPDVVIDHHPLREGTERSPFTDIRSRHGATSTILYELLRQAGLMPDGPMATALLYGIRSDTQDFGRSAIQADIDAYGELYPLADKRALGRIQRGTVPTEYFRMLEASLDRAIICGDCVYCPMGRVEEADMVAEVADLLLRHEDVAWSLCWGYHGGQARLSLRSRSDCQRADAVIGQLVGPEGSGGGHQSMAGGEIPLNGADADERVRLDKRISRRFLRATRNDPNGCRKLV